MVDADQKFLHFVNYKDLGIWAVKNYLGTRITSKYPVESIGKHIKQQTKKIKLFEMCDEIFGILGVSNTLGMFDAYEEKGKNINQAYKVVENGYLAYNPYRINVGSIGIKTEKLNNKYISPAYVVFSCNETLQPEFLYNIFRSDKFNTLIKKSTTGSVRQTLGFDVLSTIKIPVPPIKKQQSMLKEYNETISNAIKLEEKAKNLEAKIYDFLFLELGIEKDQNFLLTESSEYKKLSFVEFSKLDVWSTEYLLNKNSCDFVYSGKYPAVPARKFIKNFQYGLSEKANRKSDGIPILRMNNIVNSELVYEDIKYLEKEFKTIEKFILNKGDLLFNRTNSKELVGKTAIFTAEGNYVFASYLIRIVLDDSIVNRNYVNILFNSPIIRCQIDLYSRQVLGQANINSTELQMLRFPLPPLNIQNQIADEIDLIKREITKLKNESLFLYQKAKEDFANEIFG